MKIRDFIKNNRIVLIFFILSTLFFIIQHYLYISWDFSVYVSNAKYWFSHGNYFELIRPPLASLIIGILSFFKFYEFGKYAFIILSSLLYFVMCIKLADKLKINKVLFYALCLNPYALTWATSVGTELFTLSLIGFFVLSLLNNLNGGILLGLASITRYQTAPLSALILFYKKPSKIAINAIYFSVPILLWLGFNYYSTGNPLTAIADSYAQNVLARQEIIKPFDFTHLLTVLNTMLPLFIFFIYRLKEGGFRAQQIKERKINLIMLAIAIFTIYTYAATPSKEIRYLFNLTLPFAYFSAKALNKFDVNKIGRALGLIFLIGTIGFFIANYPNSSIPRQQFEQNMAEIDSLGIKNCSIRSDVWPLLSYYGFSANFNRIELTQEYIEEGEYLVLFPKYGEYKYTDLNESFVIKRTNDYIVMGNEAKPCNKAKPIYHSFLRGYNETLFLFRNETANINPYDILFKKACC